MTLTFFKSYRTIAVCFFYALVSASCSKDQDGVTLSKNIFSIHPKDNTIMILNGVISSNSLTDFNALYANNPLVKTLYFKNSDGSMDDQTNLILAQRVFDLQLNTHLMDNATIASGAVDLFLAGKQRTHAKNTKVGVHAWADQANKQATDYPKGHAVHSPYIAYYTTIGFSKKQAEAFYYFTIHAAKAADMHWMSAKELTTYNIFTNTEK